MIRPALDTILRVAIDKNRIVGAVCLACQNGHEIYRGAIGHFDREADIPMPDTALFRLASLSKLITTCVIGVLIKQGRLSLDAPVTRYLPYFIPTLPDGSTPVITIRHLLSHTSGLGYGCVATEEKRLYEKNTVSDGLDNPPLTLEENIRRIGQLPLLFQPGTKFNYSLGLDVLGGVIEAVVHTSFQNVLKRLITEPLGMSDTAFYTQRAERLAKVYYKNRRELLPMQDEQTLTAYGMCLRFSLLQATNKNAYPSGGGGMVGSADDVMTLLETVRKGGSSIFDESFVNEMHTSQTGDAFVAPGCGFGFGGKVLTDRQAAKSPQGQGTLMWGGVYGHWWFIDFANALSMVLLTNTAFEGAMGPTPALVSRAFYP